MCGVINEVIAEEDAKIINTLNTLNGVSSEPVSIDKMKAVPTSICPYELEFMMMEQE